ncbi:HD-GYP domain-containing protein [Desulfosudis oleivorans]|uniref:Putative PAS/PAC sensor protein n=1 Tax=Desulfosudis oleivorans (strain DSM 6200 / JCM 39069 / Hxd3) TaxID=96561 RepID=A8ZYX0_DESOH|nr:HD domain-containing phosphohydrolase [Desulfosudis oleivorans]ABW67225.1 putative PAS/PAC sensor protein [Desulfosudis oleivorans Hxd3]
MMPEPTGATAAAQRIRKRHFLMSAASYLIIGMLLVYVQQSHILDITPILLYTLLAAALTVNIAFYVVISTGLNTRLNDPSLTLAQVITAIALLMALTYVAIELKGLILTGYLLIFLFGTFYLQVHQFLILTIFAAAGHGLVILLLAFSPGRPIHLQTELMYWVALVAILPCFAVLCGDVSRLRKRSYATHRQLKTSEARYRGLHDNMTDASVLLDLQGRILTANAAFLAIVGIQDVRNLSRYPFVDLLHPEDRLAWQRQLGAVDRADRTSMAYLKIIDRDEQVREMECKTSFVGEAGDVTGLLMTLRDMRITRKLKTQIADSYKELEQAKSFTILGLAKLTEFRDKNTGDHLERIRGYTRILATQLATLPNYADHITDRYINDISVSSVLHDIGKVGMPDTILFKPGPLTSEEFEIIKQHALLGGEAIEKTEGLIQGESFLNLGKIIAYCHHERWDGSGYPMGLAGEEIPLAARIVALADVYDALTTRRVYKDAIPHEAARAIIVAEKGRHFDPDVVDAFCACDDQVRDLARKAG